MLAQVLTKLAKCPPILAEYAADRGAVFRQLREQVPSLSDVADKVLKKAFLRGVHGGKHRNAFAEFGITLKEPIPFLERWELALREAMKKLMKHRDYRDLAKDVKVGTFTSRVWMQEEMKMAVSLIEFFKEKKYIVGGYRNDGIMVERVLPYPQTLDPSLLKQAEAYYQSKHGYTVTLAEEDETPSAEDWALYWGAKALQKIQPPWRMPLYLLAREGQLSSCKRYNGWLMKSHDRIPGVFVRHEEGI